MPTNRTVTQVDEFTATGNGRELAIRGRGAAFLEGTFVGTAVLECRPPGTLAFVPVIADPATGQAVSLTAPGSFAIDEPREDVNYRWRCSQYTSGTIRAGLSAT